MVYTIATGDWDGTISFWDSQTGLLKSKSIGQTEPIKTLAFSPDSQILVSGGNDNKIHIWNVNGCEKIFTIKEYDEPIEHLAFSPNGVVIACRSDDNTFCLWDIHTGEKVTTLMKDLNNYILSITVFSPDGTRIASNLDDHSIKIWNAEYWIRTPYTDWT